MIDVTRLLRPHLLGLTPYRSARDEFKGRAEVMLDANESPYPGQLGLNRYPDPMQTEVRQTLSGIHDVPLERIFIGNGSDEVLDLLFRAYCEPGRDKVLISPPTYGMYQTLAEINGVGIVRCDLEAETFQLPMPQIRPLLADPSLKLVFLCSPNNPTGNLLRSDDIEEILRAFQGLVVVDEAYIPYAEADSWVRRLDAYRNLVVVQTLSKSQALAGARVGIGFGDPEVLSWLRRIKPPYNLGDPAQKAALAALSDPDGHEQRVSATLQERAWLERHLPDLPCVRRVFSSDANFLLVEVDEPRRLYEQLAQAGIIVRDRSHEVPGCLRITVGTPSENRQLLEAMRRLCGARPPLPPSPADPIIIP